MIRYNLEVTENISDADFARNLPKAIALGLTKTATNAQETVQKHLPKKFTVRGPWWKKRNKFGIKMKPAEKNDTPITAQVGTDADWLLLHEGGGTKKRRSGASRTARTNESFKKILGTQRWVSIPTREVKRTKRSIIRKPERPKNLKKAFAVKTKRGNVLIMKVVGKGKRRKVTPMYLLRRKAKIKNESPVINPVRESVRINLPKDMRDSFKRVFRPRTPRKRR